MKTRVIRLPRSRSRKIRLQFKLRTLLVIVTVSSVAIWWILIPTQRVHWLAREINNGKSGAAEAMVKPFEKDEFTAKLNRIMRERKVRRELLAAKKDADGRLQVKQAEAEGERLRNLAMQGVGGGIIVALEAAKNLNLEDVTISTVENDLLDIDGMATKLGAP